LIQSDDGRFSQKVKFSPELITLTLDLIIHYYAKMH
jgi:hypothetical protein